MRYATRDRTNERNLASSAWYQFACAAAIAGHEQDAMQNLRNAVEPRISRLGSLVTENDLKSMRNDPQFLELLAALKKQFPPIQS